MNMTVFFINLLQQGLFREVLLQLLEILYENYR